MRKNELLIQGFLAALFFLLLLFLATIAIMIFESTANADIANYWDKKNGLYELVSDDKVRESILWLVEKEPSSNPIKSDPMWLWNCIKAFNAAGEKYDLPVLLMVGMTYRESVYRRNTIGKDGEIGLMQVGKMGRRHCANECSKLGNPHSDIHCGACWLRAGVDWCGTLRGGVTAFACGECKPTTIRARRAVNIRFRLWNILTSMNPKDPTHPLE